MNNSLSNATTAVRKHLHYRHWGSKGVIALLALIILSLSYDNYLLRQSQQIAGNAVASNTEDAADGVAAGVAEGGTLEIPGMKPTLQATPETMEVSRNYTAQQYFDKGMESFKTAQLRQTDPMFGEKLSGTHFQDAYENFQEAVQLDPEFAPAWSHLAASAAMLGEDAGIVLDALDKATTINPDYADAWLLRAVIFFQMGNPDEGLLALNRTIEADPHKFEALTFRAAGYRNGQRWQEALADLNQAKDSLTDKITPKQKFNMLLDRGYVLYMTHRYEDAIADLTEAVKIEPNDYYAHLVLANAYLAAGNVKETIEAFDQAVGLNYLVAIDLKQNRPMFENWLAALDKNSREYEQLESLLKKIDEDS